MGPVYDADWIEPGMHVTNLGRREMPDASADKFDVVPPMNAAGDNPALGLKRSVCFICKRRLPWRITTSNLSALASGISRRPRLVTCMPGSIQSAS